jgi:hypothetical protein
MRNFLRIAAQEAAHIYPEFHHTDTLKKVRYQ